MVRRRVDILGGGGGEAPGLGRFRCLESLASYICLWRSWIRSV